MIKKLLTFSIFLFAMSVVFAPEMGTTSRWGLVYSPCAWCGTTNNIEVHHVFPQAHWPELAYVTNLQVCLCRTDGKGCHFYIGHHGKGWDFVFTNVMEIIKIGQK